MKFKSNFTKTIERQWLETVFVNLPKMCGIWAIFGHETSNYLSSCEHNFVKIQHRGPDAWRIEYDNHIKRTYVGFHRLEIVDSLYGMQPMKLHKYPLVTLICNGEIYNYKRLGEQYGFNYETSCDVEAIIQLYGQFGIQKAVQNLDGVFAFALIDKEKRRIYFARDPYGVRPLFRLENADDIVAICSEAKGLIDLSHELRTRCKVAPFPPRVIAEYEILKDGKVRFLKETPYYEIGARPTFEPFVKWTDLHKSDILENIRTLLTGSVKKRLMSDRRIGCLLSGGLDSSLIAALLVRLAKEENLPYPIQSFAVGMGESPDILAARQVAQHIGTEHHEVLFTPEDVTDVLDKVLYHLETADITTTRASIGMYFVSKYIQETTDTIVLFSGEGADELAQGYIYFRDAPSPEAAHAESFRLLSDIYLYDGLRADRTTAAHSLELRVPFLDLQFTSYFLSLPPELRQPKDGVEKFLLRSAFDDDNLLPKNILWRHKEAFSDGVTTAKRSLFNIIQDWVDERIDEDALKKSKQSFQHCPPNTKEALYYRLVFEKKYPKCAEQFMPYFWMPRWTNVDDPSARFIKHYAAK